MSAPHRVEELALDIEFDGGDPARRSDESLARLAREILLPIVDELLDRYDDPGKVVRIDSLVLDLGVIARADYAHEMGQRLRAQLGDALTRALRGAEVAPDGATAGAAAVVTLERHESALEELSSFLHTGRLPWHADLARGAVQVEALDWLLRDGGDGLWTALAAALDDPQAARRLVSQYPARQLEQVVRRAAPAQAEALLGIVARAHAGDRMRLWQAVLAAALQGAVTPALIAQMEAGSPGKPQDLAMLERFLASGRWHGAQGGPTQALDRLLADADPALWRALTDVLEAPGCMRRLVTQFPDRQLRAILCGAAPARAAELSAMFEHLGSAPCAPGPLQTCRALILAAALGLTTIEAIRPQVQAAGGADRLRRFLETGEWRAAIGTPAALIASLVAQGEPAVRAVLARALMSDSSAGRLLPQLNQVQVTAIVSGGANAPQLHAMMELVHAAGPPRPVLLEARRLILRASLGGAVEGGALASIRARLAAMLERTLCAPVASGAAQAAAPVTEPVQSLASLVQLERFLLTGAWRSDPDTPVDALERLLAQGQASLWAVLAHALGDAAGAQRLIVQFPEAQLSAILTRSAPDHVPALMAPLTELRSRQPALAPACWRQLLAAALNSREAPLSLAALRASLLPEASPAAPPALLSRLRHFLRTGDWSSWPGSPGECLDTLLQNGGDDLWTLLAQALADDTGAHRLLQQCSESRLLALVRRAGKDDAPQLCALVDLAAAAPLPLSAALACRRLILGAAVSGPRGAATIRDLRTRIDAMLDLAPSGTRSDGDLVDLAHFLQTGLWHRDADTPSAALQRLLERHHAALWPVLSHALADEAGAERLIVQFPEPQLIAILTRAAPEHGLALLSLVAELRTHDPNLSRACWQQLLAAALDGAPEDLSVGMLRASLLPAACADAARAAMTRLRYFLHTGVWDMAPGTPGACLNELLPAGGSALWTMLSQALAQEDSCERMLHHFSQDQLMGIVRARAPRQLVAVEQAMREDRYAPRHRRDRRWRWLLAACLSGRIDAMGPQELALRLQDGQVDAMAGADMLGQLERFLQGGRWTHPDMSHAAALDQVLGEPGDALWAMLVDALADPASARRLVAHFPERQLVAILRLGAGAHATALERELERLRALIGAQRHAGFNRKEAMSGCWQRLLAAAVASSALQIDAQALGAGIAATLVPAGAIAHGPSRAGPLARLLAFVGSGRLEVARGAGEGHVELLDALLEREPGALLQALRSLAAQPGALRRLARQFPDRQLRAIVALGAPDQAGMGDDAVPDALAWQRILTLVLGRDGGDAGVGHEAPQDQPCASPVEALERLLHNPDQVARTALSAVLERSDSAWRLVSACPERQLQDVLRLAASGRAADLNAVLAQWRGGSVPHRFAQLGADRIMQVCWRHVLAAALDASAASVEPEKIGAAIAADLDALTELVPDVRKIARYLGSGIWDAPDCAPVDMMRRLLDTPGADVRGVLRAALADAEQVQRLAATFPDAQLRRVVHLVAPRSAESLVAMFDEYRGRQDGADPLLARCARQVLAAATSCEHDEHALPALRARVAAELGAPRQLARLLESGTWPHADSPEQVFDRALSVAPQALWEALRHPMNFTAGMDRLLARLPQRHWRWLLRQGAGAQAAPLMQLVDQLHAQAGTSQFAGLREQALVVHCWRAVLGAVASAGAAVRVAPLRTRILSELVAHAPMSAAAPPSLAIEGRVDKRRWPEQRVERALRRLIKPSARTDIRKDPQVSVASWRAALMADPVDAGLLAGHLVKASAAVECAMRSDTAQQTGALRSRIASRLASKGGVEARHHDLLLQAIDSAAGESVHPPRFMSAVAAALDSGEALDLDAIAAAQDSLTHTMADALAGGDPLPLVRAWRRFANRQPELVRRALRHYGTSATLRALLAGRGPDALLHDVVELLAPELAAGASLAIAAPSVFRGLIGPGWKSALWEALLESALAAHAAPDWRKAAGGSAERELALQNAWRSVAGPALPERHAAPASQPAAQGLGSGVPAPQPARQERTRVRYRAEPEPGEYIALVNAGMVLAAPYVPRLMDMLGLVKEGRFADEAAAERGAHLLQFMVTGEAEAPEYQLALNKLLCGIPLEAPVAAGIEITASERETIEGLLQALIGSWTALGRTSIDGLRQSFLQRKGELRLADEAWQLRILDGPFDMLLDRLPWSFSIVKFAWMERAIHVTWR